MSETTRYTHCRDCYAAHGIDTDAAISAALSTPLSIHCWQGDDVRGFEGNATAPGGGLAVTGNYPGRATCLEELQSDLHCALGLLPGAHRLNLHAIYGDFSQSSADRDAIDLQHFLPWIEWCKELDLGIDFNPTCFAHPLADNGWTLASPDSAIRQFWIEHCRRCRRIGEKIGREMDSPTVVNLWIPDGMKDTPVDRYTPRQRLAESLDAILADPIDRRFCVDSVESKLFGIGSESYVVGSHEFYLAYAIRNQIWLCLDSGHFHPTESIADKISAIAGAVPGILLHLSRGLRWDSDHVVIGNDDTDAILREVVGCPQNHPIRLGLDYFDASINRVAAWVIGTRAARKSLLRAHLAPIKALKEAETQGDLTTRLSLQEAASTLPFGSVWNELCKQSNVPSDFEWLATVKQYEMKVQRRRVCASE